MTMKATKSSLWKVKAASIWSTRQIHQTVLPYNPTHQNSTWTTRASGVESGWKWVGSTHRVSGPTQKNNRATGSCGSASYENWDNRASTTDPLGQTRPGFRFFFYLDFVSTPLLALIDLFRYLASIGK